MKNILQTLLCASVPFMKYIITFQVTVTLLLLNCVSTLAAVPAAPSKPNIILLFIDDWAWNGSPVPMDDKMENSRMPVLQMPNVERLAREGMKFRNAYASPQCSPSRVCVQTGQSSPRNGFTVFMNDRGQDYFDKKGYPEFPVIPCVSDMTIDTDAVTIPEALKPLGYDSAHIGKWHMRGDPGDEGYVLHDGDTSNDPGNTLPKENNQRLPDDMSDPKLMFSVTEKAIRFMNKQVKVGKPFYLQISHYAMHEGRECLPATREKYVQHPLVQAWYKKNNTSADKINRKQDPAIWLGMGEDLDGRIGAVLDRIEELGIEDNTYVVMISDNGYRHKELQLTGLTQPLHGAKWWVWQGGIRVPMIVRGPGIKPGSVFNGNVVNYDLLPTFVEWAGGDPKKLSNIDGVSLASYMAGQQPDAAFLNRYLYFHYPHYRSGMPHSAIVSGLRKVLHFYEQPNVPMLFDLSSDQGEVNNIALADPQEHQRLHDELMRFLKEVNARIPQPNPDYDPAVYKQSDGYEQRMTWGPFKDRRPLDDDEIKNADN
ncbi:sulfatase [Rubinisphaera sp.]|uniref:sulfatase n=1 Tax=Rubinisphaera sp. TaxID=2024857 RepID=UPI0025EB10CE|nr:sulfatase [Rubinisphaera sp.]|tara:strand:- start:1095 stop:2714 length:1620 start_codon:yes stop_codon:yes gene_type:complete